MQLPPLMLRPTNQLLGKELPPDYYYLLFKSVILFKIGITHFLGYLEHILPFPGENKSLLHLLRRGNIQRANHYKNS